VSISQRCRPSHKIPHSRDLDVVSVRGLALSPGPAAEAVAAALLIDPFNADEHAKFVSLDVPSLETMAYPLLFAHVQHPTMSRPTEPGTLLIADDLAEFRRNLKVFTRGANTTS